MNDRVAETIMRGGEPDTLTDAELDRATEPLTRTLVPKPVRAWVRRGKVPLRVDAEAVAWTANAVAIKWPAPDGAIRRAWVSASAVSPR